VALIERDDELAAVDEVLARGGVLVVEGGAGLGKTAVLDEACRRAAERGHEVLRARGSALEADYAFGVVLQLFERRLASASRRDRDALLRGAAAATRPLLLHERGAALDTTFGVLHGLYWLALNVAEHRPLAVVVDDVHWADAPSLRWLSYLAPRLDGVALALLVGSRPGEPAAEDPAFESLRAPATRVELRLLSDRAVAALVRGEIGADAGDELCARLAEASGGNPFYLGELLRSPDPGQFDAGGGDGIVRHVVSRIGRLDPEALALARALAVLGDGCPLRYAAAVAGLAVEGASTCAAGLVRREVLAGTDPPRFLHPIVRSAVEASMAGDDAAAAHHAAAHLLFDEGAPPGQVAVHVAPLPSAGDAWAVRRLREAAQAATEAGAPGAAGALLRRALDEPPPAADRVDVLRELARAEVNAGRETACTLLEEALALTDHAPTRAAIALEIAEAYAGLFRWVDAVDVIERALDELGDIDAALSARLFGELVVAGLHDARRAARVGPALARLEAGEVGDARGGEAFAVAVGMSAVLAGRPACEAAAVLERALSEAPTTVDNWDTRAAMLWSLVIAERYDAVGAALEPMRIDVHRSGSARGFVATYSSLALLQLRLGALPEADAAARVTLRVLQEGDFTPGLAFGATLLAEIAIEAGELDEAAQLLDLLPTEGLAPGVGSVLIPAARGRLRLAQGRPGEALVEFETCIAMFDPDVWGVEVRDAGYLHARSGAALALLRLGQRRRALALARAELADATVFGAPRAIGVATRVAGLVQRGETGLELLADSVEALRSSPASLELAKSLAELGAARRRAGQRVAARAPLAEALDLAARCGARSLAVRIRDELTAAGARPRRVWRRGVEALTPSELRVVRLAADGRTNREIAHELYVTIKTVEGHLGRAYAKLGITGRAGLGDALAGEKTRVPTP
jgi:DNA-binding CsgD family transcriptional regulator